MKLKDLKPGSPAKLESLSSDEHKTTPPSRFSEVKLVATLEEKNIGRPSTFSSIVSLIQDRGYVAKKGTQLYPTPLGFAVARLLAAKFPTFTAYEYTAEMENKLDEIALGKQTRINFLDSFWSGESGFEKLLETLSNNIDFKELEQYSRINLYNGYSIRFTKFGTFLQDDNGKPDEKGYLPSARIDNDVDVWDFKDIEHCEKTFEQARTKVEAKELGVLESGEYEGWTVTARTGKFGPFLQALHPAHVKAAAAGKKAPANTPAAVNHALPEDAEISNITLEAYAELFAEVKLPRWSPDKKWLVGIGKRGAYMGRKATPKSRPIFRGLPEDVDPRAVTFAKVEELWKEADEKKASAKKPATKKTTK